MPQKISLLLQLLFVTLAFTLMAALSIYHGSYIIGFLCVFVAVVLIIIYIKVNITNKKACGPAQMH
ncbi:MAG: hypothetical protein FWD78_02435 [Treponema sp.]|nr:hypothetical protein [Treponema sp.]